jgi:hypothetical protein
MIDIKSAVKRAKEYLAEFFPEKIDSIRLEETELNEDGNFWKVTLSFLEEREQVALTTKSALSDMFQASLPSEYRVYKSLKIRAKDGELIGMNIWKA